jgi:hypothetical protein
LTKIEGHAMTNPIAYRNSLLCKKTCPEDLLLYIPLTGLHSRGRHLGPVLLKVCNVTLHFVWN